MRLPVVAIAARLVPLHCHLRDDMTKFKIFIVKGVRLFVAALPSDAAGDPP